MQDNSENVLHNFNQFIGTHADGALNDKLSQEMREMNAQLSNQAIKHGGKPKGRITLVVDFVLDQGVMDIDTSVAVKMPKEQSDRSVYWLTENNKLSKSNPRQAELPLRAALQRQPATEEAAG